ncbi:hypothetical protein [Clostridium cuniculi]|uniref:hypothetical protein n=1 Tax=Clostridium cuniculi TaxID=2548455 RepID=UPI001055211F|nr:hypothetical protein [Clostridium cuniculi]
MIRIICDKCNKDANFFGAKELTKEKIDKLSIEYNTEFQSKLMIETYVCSSCSDVRDFIHVLY